MTVNINVVGQTLAVDRRNRRFVAGTQKFIRFVFHFDLDWDGLIKFAQFTQGENAYNVFLDSDNSVYLPIEVVSGPCTICLQGNNGTTIAKSMPLTFAVYPDPVKAGATGTHINLTLYDQLTTQISDLYLAQELLYDAVDDAIQRAESAAEALLNGSGGDLNSHIGWTPTQITLLDNFRVALDTLMSHIGYDGTDGDTYADAVTASLTALVDSLRSVTPDAPDEPDEPERTLTGLSVSPVEMTLEAGTTDLSVVANGLTVLATYDSGDPDTLVYGDTYTLTVSGSDTLSTGKNIVTVRGTGVYDGLTAVDITVTVPAVEVPTHTVTFVADGVTVGTVTYTEGRTSITDSAPSVPYKQYYTGEWPSYTLGTTDITVTAVYTPIKYTITFRDDSVDHPQTYTYDTRANVTAPAITQRTGYTAAWPTWKVDYTNSQIVEAVYTIKSYTVTFNLQGHGTQIASLTVEHGNTVAQPTAPTATDWIFDGWYTDSGNTTPYDFGTGVASDITLYAKWNEAVVVYANSATANVNYTTDYDTHREIPTSGYMTLTSDNGGVFATEPTVITAVPSETVAGATISNLILVRDASGWRIDTLKLGSSNPTASGNLVSVTVNWDGSGYMKLRISDVKYLDWQGNEDTATFGSHKIYPMHYTVTVGYGS